MSDFDQTSLRDELEVRVIALLAGELSETEADQLEKILANDSELSAFRDRMAELMGELHHGRDEFLAPESESPRKLSQERRAKIFGDSSVLEVKSKSKRVWLRPAFWGVAASIAMVFMLSALLVPSFNKVRSISASADLNGFGYDASGMGKPEAETWEFEARLESREATPEAGYAPLPAPSAPDELGGRPNVPIPQTITVNDPSDLQIPALDIDVKVDNGPVYGRGGGGFGEGLSRRREMREKDGIEKGEAVAGQVIPVDIPAELLEGTPQPIRVPNLEPAPTEAPRMVVAVDSFADPVAATAPMVPISEVDRASGSVDAFEAVVANDDIEAKFTEVTKTELSELGFDWAPQSGSGKKPIADNTELTDMKESKIRITAGTPLDFVDRSSDVARLSEKGRAHFLNGDYDAAAEAFDEMSSIDPDNSEAKLFANRIDSIKSQGGEVKSREEMLTEVDLSWETPHVFR
ncbi:MAG: tetratricopeptide repeat protein, partial [Opitutales bacterium]